jgi:GTP:adenosylcobinamide-phosphate guanylyltransferase
MQPEREKCEILITRKNTPPTQQFKQRPPAPVLYTFNSNYISKAKMDSSQHSTPTEEQAPQGYQD